MHFDFFFFVTNIWNTLIVFSPILKGTLENGFKGVFCRGVYFLHNEPLLSFIDSLLSVFSPHFSPPFWFPFYYFWVLVLFILSAGFPSLLRHQTWALLRSVERALGSTNRITGVARAGVYGVCLHWPGPGEGWVTLRWDFLPLLYAAAAASFLPPSLPAPLPPVCPARLSWPLSSLQPRPAGLSVGSPTILFFTSLFGKKGINSTCPSVCVNGVCAYVSRGFVAGCTVQTASLRLVRNPKLAGRGLEDSGAWWLGQ